MSYCVDMLRRVSRPRTTRVPDAKPTMALIQNPKRTSPPLTLPYGCRWTTPHSCRREETVEWSMDDCYCCNAKIFSLTCSMTAEQWSRSSVAFRSTSYSWWSQRNPSCTSCWRKRTVLGLCKSWRHPAIGLEVSQLGTFLPPIFGLVHQV